MMKSNDMVACPSCGSSTPPGDRCAVCGNPLDELDEAEAQLVLPAWGRLRVRVLGDPAVVVPALREVWRDYETHTPVKTYASQLAQLTEDRRSFTLYGPDFAAARMPILVAERIGQPGLVDVAFEPMSDDDFEAAVGKL